MKQLVWTASIALLLAPLVGCGKTAEHKLQDEAHATIARALETPGEDTLEHENRIARTLILNERSGAAEWRRFWLLDRPSRDMYNPMP